MDYLISAVLGFLFGSIPTAYLLLKTKKGIDITKTGSGNVGAMNSYEITNSKKIGIFVLVIDFLKGLLPVLILKIAFSDVFIYPALALIFAIFSHCFNPWISFKGGRGLATAAGGTIILFPYMLLVWIILWLLVYLIKKDILLANILATILSLIIIYLTKSLELDFAFPKSVNVNELVMLTTSGLLIIFIKHIEPLKEIILKK
jgi:glycerol-3-phosphate acyltransferase PlsY